MYRVDPLGYGAWIVTDGLGRAYVRPDGTLAQFASRAVALRFARSLEST